MQAPSVSNEKSVDMKQLLVELQAERPVRSQLERIVDEWTTGAHKSLLIHVICGLADVSLAIEVACAVREQMPDARLVGTMSAGEICEGRLIPRGLLVSAIFTETSEVSVFRYDEVKGREAGVGDSIRCELEGIEDLKAAELVFPGTAMDTHALYGQLSMCRGDVQVFGGYSGGHVLNSSQYFLFDADGIMQNSIFVVAYAGADLHVNMDKAVGWDALGLPLTVTKADGNRLIELDGHPASEVYERFLQIDRTQIDNALAGYEFPLMTTHEGDECLRSTIHIDEDGALVLHGHVPEESQVYLSYGNPSSIVKKVNSRLDALRGFGPQVIFLFSCIVRKQFWGELVDMEMRPFAELASTVGFHTWGEVMRDASSGEVVEHNVTLLSIAMREGSAPAGEMPLVRVDDSALRGQASLLSRLASLVNTTMRELQAANNDLVALNRRLTIMAERDALTNLFNRGKTEELIGEALDGTVCCGDTTSLVMADVDFFKHVNDTFGHDVGDSVLRDVAFLLRESIAGIDGASAGRWGGEEFFLVLPHLGLREATEIAENLRKRMERHEFMDAGNLTMSLGVIAASAADAAAANRRLLFTKVDDALYRAKKSGRNRVMVAN